MVADKAEHDPQQQAQAVSELLDFYHERASISDGERIMIEPGKVLDNITHAMERVDADINTEISIEHDVVPLKELSALIEQMYMGPALVVRVVNTAMRIMSARYPRELVENPLPDEYDLSAMTPLSLDELEHAIAKTIFNQRTTNGGDLAEEDVADQMADLDLGGQIQVFVGLFYMYGTKVGALKHRTGIE